MVSLSRTIAKQALRVGRAIHRRTSTLDDRLFDSEPCPACGENAPLVMGGVLWPELILQWQLTPAWANWMDQREGLRCRTCRSNIRSRQLAATMMRFLNERTGSDARSLRDCAALAPRLENFAIAEINAAGGLHPFLSAFPGLRYSEYGSTTPGIPSEDLQDLSYETGSFDMAITSDVLEHVPDVKLALAEILRILKPGGVHVFTVPVVWSQEKSRLRAEIRNGTLEHRVEPSYHGSAQSGKADFLVFHEFGRDFLQTCLDVGFEIELIKDDRNPSLVTFVGRRSRAT